MKPRRGLRFLLVLPLLAVSAVSAAAQDGAVDTILRRPLDESAVSAPSLGPTRLQGEFAPHLEDLLAQAQAESTTAVTYTSEAPAPVLAAAPRRAEHQGSVAGPILLGAVGGLAGLYGGAVAGYQLAGGDGTDWEDIGPALLGALVGEIVLLPLGVHVGNAEAGSFGADLGISVLTGGVGLALGGIGDGAGLIAGALLQLGAVVGIERSVAHKRIVARQAAAPAP